MLSHILAPLYIIVMVVIIEKNESVGFKISGKFSNLGDFHNGWIFSITWLVE